MNDNMYNKVLKYWKQGLKVSRIQEIDPEFSTLTKDDICRMLKVVINKELGI